jgi:glucose-1-phosphate cytidylyltransferase
LGTEEQAGMKAVILCGGRGTRLNEHGESTPKALMKVGERPLIWHLCKYFAHFGINEFVLCLGYLKEQFGNYFEQSIYDARDEKIETSESGRIASDEGWTVTLVDTYLDTNTGGRLKFVQNYLREQLRFFLTYGDGLSNVDLNELTNFHNAHSKIATLTAVNPMSNFGLIDLDDSGRVVKFREKPKLAEWVNGGFFIFENGIFEYLSIDSVLEREPFEQLAQSQQLMAYRHNGFWKCMDTYKDNIELNELWTDSPAWKVW